MWLLDLIILSGNFCARLLPNMVYVVLKPLPVFAAVLQRFRRRHQGDAVPHQADGQNPERSHADALPAAGTVAGRRSSSSCCLPPTLTLLPPTAVHSSAAGAGGRRWTSLQRPDLGRHQRARQALRPHVRGPGQVPRVRRPDPQVSGRRGHRHHCWMSLAQPRVCLCVLSTCAGTARTSCSKTSARRRKRPCRRICPT